MSSPEPKPESEPEPKSEPETKSEPESKSEPDLPNPEPKSESEFYYGVRTECLNVVRDSFLGETLEEALEYFGLHSRLRDVDFSLQDVRQQRKSRDEHESCLKLLDEDILQLRYKHHPDRVKVLFEKDIEIAQNRLAALNAVKTVSNMLKKTFLVDSSDVDHVDECDIRQHIYQVSYKISYLSEKRQEYLIWEIRLFLSNSKNCVKSFIEKKWFDFFMYRDRAIGHLSRCLAIYEKLIAEFEAAEEEFESKSLYSAHKLIKKMLSDCFRDFFILRDLERVIKVRLEAGCPWPVTFFNIVSVADMTDGYFVWPFVHYVNVILMCNAMIGNLILDISELDVQIDLPVYNPEQSAYFFPFYLVLHLCGRDEFDEEIREKLENYFLDEEDLKTEFIGQLKEISEYLKIKFSVKNYIERSSTNYLVGDLMECLIKMDAIGEEDEQEKVISDIRGLFRIYSMGPFFVKM